jgi:phosphoribosylaminoimidazole synthetase
MAGMYSNDEYDLAGFCVGAVSRSKVLPKFDLMRSTGDILLGLRSSGLHSNGYSLVRKCVQKSGLQWTDPAPFQPDLPLGEALLCPTKIYVKSILALTKLDLVKGMAHITGGGFPENIPRMLPAELMAVVDINWTIPAVFRWIQEIGDISTYEMMRTLNCGIGMVLLIAQENKDQVLELLSENGETDVVHLGFTASRPHVDAPQVLIRGEF